MDHNILLNIMNCTIGVSDTALNWFSCLLSRSQCTTINGTVSDQFDLDQGVPQGSCLGPVKFMEYSSPVFYALNQHGKLGHAYTDDHQVYCTFHPDSMDSDYESMERCISDIRSWMQSMKLNDSKTEYILILQNEPTRLLTSGAV